MPESIVATATPADLPPDEQIDFFFAPPLPHQEPVDGYRSTLHLLRRELQDCLVGRLYRDELAPVAKVEKHRRVFATALVIWTGMDLLAKCHAGRPDPNDVGAKFKKYVDDIIVPRGGFVITDKPSTPEAEISETAGEVLYHGMRNPMTHSFNLSASEFDVILYAKMPPTFVVNRVPTIEILGGDDHATLSEHERWLEQSINYTNKRRTYEVNLSGLYQAFVQSIGTYRDSLTDDGSRQRFLKTFQTLGFIANS